MKRKQPPIPLSKEEREIKILQLKTTVILLFFAALVFFITFEWGRSSAFDEIGHDQTRPDRHPYREYFSNNRK